ILPTSKKLYLIINNSGYAITAKVSGQTGITIPNGYRRYAISNGTDIIPFINYMDGVSLNSAILTSPQIINAQASHDYQGAAADWTLSAAEQKVSTLIVTNANGACAIIAPAVAGTRYVVKNTSGQALTIKKTGGTGVTIASTKTAIVEYIGSDYSRITADA
ncbi:MAG: hypothetical protein Q8908_13915, partial [Bacteroidota bacterium]|nr:hypothetical protein [Bacteroidota bacterium]